jgi:hypothetical protein
MPSYRAGHARTIGRAEQTSGPRKGRFLTFSAGSARLRPLPATDLPPHPGRKPERIKPSVRTCSDDLAGPRLRPVPPRVEAHLALAVAAELRQIALADALSLLLLIREDKPLLYDKAAVRWFAKYVAEDRYLLLRDPRELINLLDGLGRHDQVAVVRLKR